MVVCGIKIIAIIITSLFFITCTSTDSNELNLNTFNSHEKSTLRYTLLKNFAKNEFGIQPERINFAKKVSFDAHIQRHQIIDLFLDTFPYNAHTSASDSLWAGCPIISVSGETFASRVAGSILTEIGCSELVVSSFEEYEKKAIELASQPNKLISLKNLFLYVVLFAYLFLIIFSF